MADSKSPFGYTKVELPQVGKLYYIDEVQNGKESIVTVVEVYGKIFCKVRNHRTGYTWETMCNRLTEINE